MTRKKAAKPASLPLELEAFKVALEKALDAHPDPDEMADIVCGMVLQLPDALRMPATALAIEQVYHCGWDRGADAVSYEY